MATPRFTTPAGAAQQATQMFQTAAASQQNPFAAASQQNPFAGVQAERYPTLGREVYRNSFVPADRKGAYIGADTYVNKQRDDFNKKKAVVLTREWANVLNRQVQQGLDNGSGMAFEEDLDAHITVPPNGQVVALVPGSQAQIQQVLNGAPYGLVSVRNPANTYKMLGNKYNNDRKGSFMRVGGDAYRRLLRSALTGITPLPQEKIVKLVQQGYLYGFAPAFQQMGIAVTPNGIQGLSADTFDESVMKSYYDKYFKNPDQQNIGRFAAASLARNYANTGRVVGPNGEALDPAKVVNEFARDGTVSGKFKWAPGYKSSKQRAGLTTHPLRTPDGTAIDGPVLDPNAGECNIYGSGPGMGGNGSDAFQLRLQKAQRQHRKKSSKAAYGARAGTDRSIGAPTYYCAPTKGEIVDASRAIYQPGGARGGDVGLANALDQIASEINNPNVSAGALAQSYAQWSTDPSKIPDQFRVPSNLPGRQGKGGFALFRAAQQNIGKQEARRIAEEQAARNANQFLPQAYKQ